MLLLWPMFFVLDYTDYESFQWPTNHQWVFLLINGLVGTVVSEALWLWQDVTPLPILKLIFLCVGVAF